MEKIIAVGSTNPVKVKAVTKATQSFWNDVSVISLSVPSGVSDMPLSKDEARIGAKNRAIGILKQTEAWLGVGNEGGVCWIEGDLYLFSTTYITDGKMGSYGGETLMKLPQNIVNKFGKGTTELGTIMNEITGRENVKQKDGAVGYLSDGRITRTDIFKISTQMALSIWYNSS